MRGWMAMVVVVGSACAPKVAAVEDDAGSSSDDGPGGGSALSGQTAGEAGTDDGDDVEDSAVTADGVGEHGDSEAGMVPCEPLVGPELQAWPMNIQTRVSDVLVVDLDADGRSELLLAEPTNGAVAVIRGTSSLHADLLSVTPSSGPTFALASGDLDGDTAIDLVLAYEDGRVEVQLGDGDGGLAPSTPLPVADLLYDVAVGDLDGDGVLDVVALGTANQAGRVWWLRGLGDGGLDAAIDLTPGDWPRAYTSDLVILDDVTRPGAHAVVAQLWDNDQQWVAILRPDAAPDLAIELPYGATGIGAGDLDTDGIVDLVALGIETAELWRWSGLAGGGFADAVTSVGRSGIGVGLAVGDLDGVGGVDVAATYGLDPVLERALSTCDAAFDRAWVPTELATDLVHVVATGDLDGDEIDDIVVVDGPFAGQTVTAFLTADR